MVLLLYSDCDIRTRLNIGRSFDASMPASQTGRQECEMKECCECPGPACLGRWRPEPNTGGQAGTGCREGDSL
jgi:hypothetical protein